MSTERGQPQWFLVHSKSRRDERARITEGSFSRLEAIFVANDGNERVVLLLKVLQQEQELTFP